MFEVSNRTSSTRSPDSPDVLIKIVNVIQKTPVDRSIGACSQLNENITSVPQFDNYADYEARLRP